MLEKVKRALLLSDVPSFAENYKALALDVDVQLSIESEWNKLYRVNADVVILGSKYLEKLNRSYYSKAVVILKEGESPSPLIKMGIMRFIFNYKNNYELICAFYRADGIVVHAVTNKLDDIIKGTTVSTFCFKDYNFDFANNVFKYKGKGIYMADSVKKYLAEWLLYGNKDNKKRMIICNLRKKLGKEFLSDVDRFGQVKECKSE